MKTRLVCVLFCAFIPLTSHALSGQDLVNKCNANYENGGNEAIDKAICVAYLNGILNGFEMMFSLKPESKIFCLPDVLSAETVIQIVKNRSKEATPIELNKTAQVLTTFAFVTAYPCSVADTARKQEPFIDSRKPKLRNDKKGSSTCKTSGVGPGNSASCGGSATTCVTTGVGAGNAAACGGLATQCITTGVGSGNTAACGGRATRCVTTGVGKGNDAACGGLSTSCITTGVGSGNAAACGGKATSCVSTGVGKGNSSACGGEN